LYLYLDLFLLEQIHN